MNENTLVAICGYEGDAHLIKSFMPFHIRHQCPLLVLSPEDSVITPGTVSAPAGTRFRSGGKRQYIGALSLARQKRHIEIMLEYPYNWFLAHDADSVGMLPEIPKPMYASDGVFWAGIVSDAMHIRPRYDWPKLAFQPPYFFSRRLAEIMLAAWDRVPMDHGTPYIDNHMMHVVCAAGISYKNLVFTVRDVLEHQELGNRIPNDCSNEESDIGSGGRVFYHPVKDEKTIKWRASILDNFLKKRSA